jgi:cysteine sulfinate desulfinase/cysteine desulfurase-like protein
MTRMPETYLDAASTTPLHPQARAALLAAVDEFGDPSRLYGRGRRARLLLDRSREKLAAAVGAHPEEVVLTSDATDGEVDRLLEVLPAAVAELREMADLDSQALDRVAKERR